MISQIFIDIIPYTMVYGVIILALVAFCIVDMPVNPAFADSSTITGGVLSSMFLAWQTSVMGDFDVGNYSTVLAKLVFVLFTAFGNLSASTRSPSPPTSPFSVRTQGSFDLSGIGMLLCSHAQPTDRGHGRLLRQCQG